MSIVSLTPYYVGQVDQLITRWKLVCTDSLAVLTAAGYLNTSNLMGYKPSPNDVFDVIYSYTGSISQLGTGTYTECTPTIAYSLGVATYTLNQIPQSGVSPSVAGDFVIFSNTTGGLADSSQKPTNAASPFVVTSPGTVVAGNLPDFADVNGTLADSGIVAANLTGSAFLKTVQVTLNTAAMAAAYATPQALIANPLASQMILILSANVYTASTGHTAYTTGTAPIIQYSSGGTNGAHGTGTIATATGLVAGDITAATSQVRNLFEIATGVQTGLSGLGIYFSNATGAYAGGTGTNVTFTISYLLLTATV